MKAASNAARFALAFDTASSTSLCDNGPPLSPAARLAVYEIEPKTRSSSRQDWR
jgi:hypothetical protein